MSTEVIFEGFEHNPYEAEARGRWGHEAVDAAYERMQGWSADDAERARTGFGRVHEGLAPLVAEGAPVADRRVHASGATSARATTRWSPTCATRWRSPPTRG